MPKTSLKTSLKSPLCSCEHCSVNKCGRDQLPQCQTHSSVCFTSPTLCPHAETFLENFMADFTAASPKMILLCLVTWLPLILCYVGNFCRLWMCYYLEDNNLFIISFGYSCYAVISGFKYAVSRKHAGWHCTCCNQNKRKFVTYYIFFSLLPQSCSNFNFSLFLGFDTKFPKDVTCKEERNFSDGIWETYSSFVWKLVTGNIMSVAHFTKETSI